MTVHYKIQGEYLLIVGHTYPHRDSIRNLGAFFDRNDKVWKLARNQTTEISLADLCRTLGGGPLGERPVIRPAVDLETPVLEVKAAIVTVDVPGLTVSQLINQVQGVINQIFAGPVWVIGEVQNCNRRGQTIYFQLAEAKNSDSKLGTVSLSATLWQTNLKAITKKIDVTSILADGMQIRALCQVGIYRDRGMISLSVLDIDANFTKGALALAREQLLKELRAKGLDKKNKQLALTNFPFTIGLISADQSRAKSDFLHQLESYGFGGRVIFKDARMQGEKIVEEVVRGLAELQKQSCDIIVITRGGGSAADLRWFDSREIAYAVANSGVPILAAIGHHDDVCVAEEIAFQREKTPTAAADFIINRLQQTREKISKLSLVLAAETDRRVKRDYERLSYLKEKLFIFVIAQLERKSEIIQRTKELLNRVSQQRLNERLHETASLKTKIEKEYSMFLLKHLHQLEQWLSRLQTFDPTPWLDKGWTQLVYNGKRIRNAADVSMGDLLQARLRDGTLNLQVQYSELIPQEKKP